MVTGFQMEMEPVIGHIPMDMATDGARMICPTQKSMIHIASIQQNGVPNQTINITKTVVGAQDPAVVAVLIIHMIVVITQMELHGMEMILIAGSDRVWYDRGNNADGTPWYGNDSSTWKGNSGHGMVL